MHTYLIIDGQQSGPYEWAQVQTMLETGQITPETLFWREGEPDWKPLATITVIAEPPAPAPTAVDLSPRQYAGFWRRVGAFVVDCIVLGLSGQFLGTLFYSSFCHLGGWGPLVGLMVAWPYFAVQNSALGGGQTLGKRALGIQVVDENGRQLSIDQSFLRSGALVLPYFLNESLVSLAGAGIAIMIFVSMIFSIWYFMMFYLLIFNWPSRRLLHDFFTGTYVVRTATAGAVPPAPFWKPHFIILVALSLAMIVLAAGVGLLMKTLMGDSLSKMIDLRTEVIAKTNAQNVRVVFNKNYSYFNGVPKKTSTLIVDANWDGVPDDSAKAARQVAAVVLDKYHDEAAGDDALEVQISYGYDIGIASAHVSQSYVHTADEWQQIVAQSTAP